MAFVPIELRLPLTSSRRTSTLYTATAVLSAVLLGTAGYVIGVSGQPVTLPRKDPWTSAHDWTRQERCPHSPI
jgi:hypothetical protein